MWSNKKLKRSASEQQSWKVNAFGVFGWIFDCFFGGEAADN
jgi:hypothetical protein